MHICANKVGPFSHDQPLQTMNLHGASKCTRITNYKSHDSNGADDLSIVNPYKHPITVLEVGKYHKLGS